MEDLTEDIYNKTVWRWWPDSDTREETKIVATFMADVDVLEESLQEIVLHLREDAIL